MSLTSYRAAPPRDQFSLLQTAAGFELAIPPCGILSLNHNAQSVRLRAKVFQCDGCPGEPQEFSSSIKKAKLRNTSNNQAVWDTPGKYDA
jgi:hypothetical protein